MWLLKIAKVIDHIVTVNKLQPRVSVFYEKGSQISLYWAPASQSFNFQLFQMLHTNFLIYYVVA